MTLTPLSFFIRNIGMEQFNSDSKERSSSHKNSSHAPWYNVPKQPIVSVEHPFIIKDVDKGLATLGGSSKLEEVSRIRFQQKPTSDVFQLVQEDGATASLYLKPGDRMAKPLRSANVNTNNILLKVTVPKRTGLKRKRGAEGAYHAGTEVGVLGERAAPLVKDAQYLLRSMCDNSKRYQVEAIGTVNQTHRFRGMRPVLLKVVSCAALIQLGMPDFVTSTVNMPLTQKLREHILPFDCKVVHSHEAHPLIAVR